MQNANSDALEPPKRTKKVEPTKKASPKPSDKKPSEKKHSEKKPNEKKTASKKTATTTPVKKERL